MTTPAELTALAERVEAASGSDNALDVLAEIALFEPCDEFASIRSNAAGTKVICTTVGGSDMTFWAQDWTRNHRRRTETAESIRARASLTR